jgi:speckle-type POZ protein
MITSFGKKATKKIMLLMKEIENREGTLEVQEELFRLEREKTIALENALVIEKKGFKVQDDLLKEKYVGPRTKGTLIKRNVWVPKILVTNTLGPKSTWVPKTQA